MLIQIDSLSYDDLTHAVHRGWMPFVKQLLGRERYAMKHLYSGVPSSTPSVQGELFYGVRRSVPAFEYLDHCGKIFILHNPGVCREIEGRLAAKAEGILKGGASYGNIFSGGAEESHFCLGALDSQSYWKTLLPYAWLLVLVFNPLSILHAAYAVIFDLGTAAVEFFRGLRGPREFREELKGIPVRAFVTLFLREFITLGCRIDIARSLPVICANFFSYDEIAHRFGKRSFFARLALKRIDRSIEKIFRSANRSTFRDYDVWIYSDHGQEATVPYYTIHRANIREKVRSALSGAIPGIAEEEITITAQGPLGFVYVRRKLSAEEQARAGEALARAAGIPLVLGAPSGKVRAWTGSGVFDLAAHGEQIFGAGHPYLEEVTREMEEICLRQDTGTFVISGWKAHGTPVSFPAEWASHGGPGRHETDAFALLPFNTPVELMEKPAYLRPSDLRSGIRHFMHGEKWKDTFRRLKRRGQDDPLRIMSYNVHSCIGMDRKLSPERIARVISRHAPDIVCLQELDRGRMRSSRTDQVRIIAELLGMTYHFNPALRIAEEEFGDAILCRHPMKLIRAGQLAGLKNIPDLETRGAIWVEIDFFGRKVHCINSHLSLLAAERAIEIEDLLGPGWMGSESCCGPIILCGDFNMLPRSAPHRKLKRRFHDAFSRYPARQSGTFPTFRPLARIDYIYVSKDVRTAFLDIPRMTLERTASDHAPLIADLVLP